MKAFNKFSVGLNIVLVAVLLVGCFSLPSVKLDKQEAKINKAEKKLDDNQKSAQLASAAYVWGAHYALSKDPEPNPYTSVAYDLTGKSLVITGNPTMKDANDFKKIVDKVTSTNLVENKEGIGLLNIKDKEIERLQGVNQKLLKDIDAAEEKYKKIAEENAGYANIAVRIKRILYWLVFIFGGLFLLRFFAVFIPPPYNTLGLIPDFIFGGLFRAGSKILPASLEAAKVVGRESYEVSEKTLTQLVQAIQEAKRNPSVKEALDPLLKDATQEETRMKIIEAKAKLKMI